MYSSYEYSWVLAIKFKAQEFHKAKLNLGQFSLPNWIFPENLFQGTREEK